jgi:1-phosphofructokinase
MVAGFVAGQVRGCDLVDSIRLATAAAAASVAKVGTRAGSLVEVKKLCDQVIIEEIG